jgi:GNAT superfamily N-acetyltransferase
VSGPRLAEAIALAAEALAAECGCSARDLAAPGVRVALRPPPLADPRARRYPPWDPALAVVSFGVGAVVSASPPILCEVEKTFADADRDGAFGPERLARAASLLAPHGLGVFGPFPRLVCGSDRWRARREPRGVRIALERDPPRERIEAVGRARFPHAFSPNRRVERPTRVLALAREGGEIVGAASAAEDSDALWQIGIDVVPAAQGRGVAAALTSALARAALDAGRAPFYGAAPANTASLRTALAAGFVPVWLEVFTASPPAR